MVLRRLRPEGWERCPLLHQQRSRLQRDLFTSQPLQRVIGVPKSTAAVIPDTTTKTCNMRCRYDRYTKINCSDRIRASSNYISYHYFRPFTTSTTLESISSGSLKSAAYSDHIEDHFPQQQSQPPLPPPISVSNVALSNTATSATTRGNTTTKTTLSKTNSSNVEQEALHLLQKVPIGRLSKDQIDTMVSGTLNLCRIPKLKDQVQITDPRKIALAEKLVHRMVQEVEYWHLKRLDLEQQQQQQNVTGPLISQQISHRIKSLGSMWQYIIMGSSHIPVPPQSPWKAGTASPTSTSSSSIQQATLPFMITGRLLTEMLQLYHDHPSIYPSPTAALYNAWLYSCYTSSKVSEDAIHTAEAILRNLEDYTSGQASSDTSGTPIEGSTYTILPPPSNIPKPTKGMYNHVILIHAGRAGTVYGAAAQAEDLLLRMSKQGVHPATDTFNRVLKAWAECPEMEGGNRAADVLHLMIKLSDDASNIEHGKEIAPNHISFGTVIYAFMKRGQPEACQLILEEAVTYYATNPLRSMRMVDLTDCYSSTMFGWAKSAREQAVERVEAIFNDGIIINEQQYKIIPNKPMYVACITAHLRSGRPDRIDQAERYLNTMIDSMKATKDKLPTISRDSRAVAATVLEFNTIINAWFQSLDEFENIGMNKTTGTHPIGYTATKASSLLNQMLALQEEGYKSCTPTIESFHMCIESWCKTVAKCLMAGKSVRKVLPSTDDAAAIAKAYDLRSTYKESMIKHAVNAVEKALSFLEMAESRQLFCDSSYATVIHALCRIDQPHYTYQAVNVLERYEFAADQHNLKWQNEKTWVYYMVISTLNHIGTLDAAEETLKILRKIPKSGKRAIHRNKIWIYNGVLAAFAKIPGPRAGAVATELFVEIISDPGLISAVDVQVYERVLWMLAEANNKQSTANACDVLNTIFDLYASKKVAIEPSTSCFNACLSAITSTRDDVNTNFAVQLLKLIISKYDDKLLSQLPSKSAFDMIIRNCNEIGTAEMTLHSKEVKELAEKYKDKINP